MHLSDLILHRSKSLNATKFLRQIYIGTKTPTLNNLNTSTMADHLLLCIHQRQGERPLNLQTVQLNPSPVANAIIIILEHLILINAVILFSFID